MQMIPKPPRFSLLIPLSILGLLLFSVGRGGSDDVKERSRAGAKELAKARESLHEAQLELAARADRIAELEAQLKEASRRKEPETAKSKPEAKTETAKSKPEAKPEAKSETAKSKPEAKPEAAKSKPEAKPVSAPSREKAQVKETPKPTNKPAPVSPSFTVQYERNTAVNYPGRDAALRWVRDQIKSKEAPEGFHIVGWANESPYADVNEEIARNRARYLADFLKINGIPGKLILSISGKRSKSDDKNGRRSEISTVGEKKGSN